MHREESELFLVGKSGLPAELNERLRHSFDERNAEALGAAGAERYLEMARRIAAANQLADDL